MQWILQWANSYLMSELKNFERGGKERETEKEGGKEGERDRK